MEDVGFRDATSRSFRDPRRRPCTVAVGNVDETVTAVQRLGATVALPKMAIPTVGWLAYIKDTEGNLLGLMANDPAAR